LNMTMLIALALALCLSRTASSQDESCADRCDSRKDNCSHRAKQHYDRCLSRADRWLEREEQEAEKDKDPDSATERVQQIYRQNKKACQTSQTKMESGCAKAKARCLKFCERRSKR
jgi:hypothetical protein